jgi:hypothetical protein
MISSDPRRAMPLQLVRPAMGAADCFEHREAASPKPMIKSGARERELKPTGAWLIQSDWIGRHPQPPSPCRLVHKNPKRVSCLGFFFCGDDQLAIPPIGTQLRRIAVAIRRWPWARAAGTYFWGDYIIMDVVYRRPPCLLQGQSQKVSPSFARVAERFIR